MSTEDNNISNSNTTMTMEYDDESLNSYDDNQDMESMTDQFDNNFHFTNLDRLKTKDDDDDDDSWDVESYAADSMEITKLRLHIISSNNNLADELGRADQGGAGYYDDDDDWTVQSDCNDSIGLTKHRFQQQQDLQQRQQQPGLVGIRRRMSMSSASTVEESFSSASATDPAASDDDDKRRVPVIRHKSMPYVKSTTTVPMWQNGISPSPPQRPPQQPIATRSVSNNGTPCAA